MSLRKMSFMGALALAGALFAGTAQAGGVNWSINIDVPGRVYAEPTYYAPPATYYAPRSSYYAPPPQVYYRPPVVVYRPGPPRIVGGSWAREHRHHPHHRHGRDERRGRDEYGDRHRGDRW